jgi:hypothetical protein
MPDTPGVAATQRSRDSRPRSQRASLLIAVAAWVLALGAAIVHNRVSPLLPQRVHVRWSDAASPDQRIEVEDELGLASGEHEQGRTWSYVLRDVSTATIARLVRHRLVEDTHYIDRATATLSVDASGQPGWARSLAQIPVVQMGVRWLPTMTLLLALVGVAGAWPLWHALVPGLRRRQRRLSTTSGVVLTRTRVLWHATRRQIWDAQGNRLSSRGRAAVQLLLIAFASMVLRVVLVVSGGQFYWGDETRYEIARDIARTLSHGEFLYAFSRMGQHPLFGVMGAVPAAVEQATHEDARIPGTFFAAFSVLNVGLLAAIAKRSGASDGESVVAGGLLALSTSMLYFARHLLPYDVAMTFGLLAVFVGIGRGARAASMLCGALAACAFLTYTGYWTLGGTAMVVHVLAAGSRRAGVRRAMFSALGLASTIGAVVVGSLAAGENLLRALTEFSRQVDQGDFGEGWRLPWEYLWHAEHFILVMWLLALVWAISKLRSPDLPQRARVGLIGVAFVYASLATLSVVTHTFVVYGRLARQVVPFLCLITAAALYRAAVSFSPRPRLLFTSAVMVVLLVQAGFNVMTPLRQVFPAEFVRDARRDGRIPADADVVAINAKRLYPGPEAVTLPSHYTVLRRAAHPLQFLPYQYEGYPPSRREALRSADIEMKLLLVAK